MAKIAPRHGPLEKVVLADEVYYFYVFRVENMKSQVVAVSYGQLSELLARLNPALPAEVDLRVVNAFMDEAVELAREIERRDEVDVFISAGANGILLAQHVKTPVVQVRVTGFDLLLAVKELNTEQPVGLVTYRRPLPFLADVMPYIKADIRQETYDSVHKLDDALDSLMRQGVRHIVGTSLVLQKAAERRLQGAIIYSPDGALRAVEAAVQMAISRRLDTERTAQLNTILTYAPCGLIATDRDGIVREYNPAAAKILGIPQESVQGTDIRQVIPNTHITKVMEAGRAELNRLQVVNANTIVTNRVPICDGKGQVQGCVVTFQDVDTIRKAEAKVRRYSGQNFKARFHLESIIGESPPMRAARERAGHFAESDATVLIEGETGTGKELFAQGIHLAGSRATHAFVAINCATLPGPVLESELFGYEGGAFTDARREGKAGLFEIGHQGTVFLDEIAELPLDLQARLLRVLEEREFLRVGGAQVIKVNIRVIAATNKCLRSLVECRQFREDLFYRLNVLRLDLPPLRQRGEDLSLLVDHFAQASSQLPPEERAVLRKHPALFAYGWPGNVRELRNFMEAVAVLWRPSKHADSLVRELLPHERKEAGSAEEACTQEELARRLGISRTTLWRRMRGEKQR